MLLDKDQARANPTSSEFATAIDAARKAMVLQQESGQITGGRVSGALTEISAIENLVIVSDLHGDYECLLSILDSADHLQFLSNKSNKLVFLGDYVDRGSNSVGVLHTICQLKVLNPDSVILMRGNHEAPAEFPFSSHNFPFQLCHLYGETEGKVLYRKILTLFKDLTIATMVSDALLLVHGGLPTDVSILPSYRSLLSSASNDHIRNSVLKEVLWNDPRDINGSEISRRGIGRHFGQEITREWLRATGTRCVIRGHEPCQGFRIDHDGSVMTLFSCRAPYPKFKAAYLSIEKEKLFSIRDANDLVPFIRFPELP